MIFTFGRLRYIQYDFQHFQCVYYGKMWIFKGCWRFSADTQCIILAECKKDIIKPLLRGFNVIDSSLKSEMHLIFARAGIAPYAFRQMYL